MFWYGLFLGTVFLVPSLGATRELGDFAIQTTNRPPKFVKYFSSSKNISHKIYKRA